MGVKKKIAIMAMIGSNIGNRLQNYGLQEYLLQLEFLVVTLDDVTVTTSAIFKVKQIIKAILGRRSLQVSPMETEREAIFAQWNKEKMCFSKMKISRYYMPKSIGKAYDYVVAGSDQIWNPFFVKGTRMLLSFVPPHKRVAYAASFGISALPERVKEGYARELRKFKAISVREYGAVKMVEELTGATPTWVLDPTMLLTGEQWRAISKCPSWYNSSKQYIVTYFLGELPAETRTFMNQLSAQYGYEIIEIYSPDNRNWRVVDPSEFLYLIDHAKIVLTDSFHGSVFSILFHKPFLIFEREDNNVSMNARIESLTKLFHLEDRIYSDQKSEQEIFAFSKSKVESVLATEREKAKAFLLHNLK